METRSLDHLLTFRAAMYRNVERRRDTLFELVDAVLVTGPVLSPPHLSMQPVHRRGWGSLYAALAAGGIEEAAVRTLLAAHPLEGGAPVYAVDTRVWARLCAGDAETSPERAFY